MSQYYHIRLTADIDNPRYAEYLSQRTVKYLMVKENADEDCKQTHLHCHFTSIHKNDQSLRREFKKWFPALSGNKDYSLKTGNEIGFYYVAKGTGNKWPTDKPDVITTSFTTEEVQEFHRRYWNHTDRTVADGQLLADVESTIHEQKVKKALARKPTWTQQLIQEIRINHPDHGYDYRDPDDKKYLVDKILLRMGEGGKALDEVIFRRIFFAVYNGLKKTAKAHTDFRKKFYDCIEK